MMLNMRGMGHMWLQNMLNVAISETYIAVHPVYSRYHYYKETRQILDLKNYTQLLNNS